MRQIKFRGFSKDNKVWVYGDLSTITGGTFVFPPDGHDSPDNYEVYPESVGEYTGLKDCERREIYEGDIVDNDAARWEVIFNTGCFCGKRIKDKEPQPIHIALRAIKEIKIIGNIYEQPTDLKSAAKDIHTQYCKDNGINGEK